MNRIFLTTRLYGRVMKWDKESQIELDVLQGLVRSYGFDAIIGNSACAADRISEVGGDIFSITFWIRMRGQYQPLTLEARAPDVFVMDL